MQIWFVIPDIPDHPDDSVAAFEGFKFDSIITCDVGYVHCQSTCRILNTLHITNNTVSDDRLSKDCNALFQYNVIGFHQ